MAKKLGRSRCVAKGILSPEQLSVIAIKLEKRKSSQFVSEQFDKASSKTSIKKIMKGLITSKQVLSDIARIVDTLDEDEILELIETLNEIHATLHLWGCLCQQGAAES